MVLVSNIMSIFLLVFVILIFAKNKAKPSAYQQDLLFQNKILLFPEAGEKSINHQ